MSEDLSRLSRLIALLRIFQTKSLVTAVELAERFDLSIRTIYRDVKALQEAGVPIYTIEGKGYSIMKDYKFSPVAFSDEEANAIITAEKFIAKNRDQSFRDNYQSAVEKIKAVLRNEMKDKANLLQDRLLYVSEVEEINSKNVAVIQQAITNQFVIEIEYTSMYKKEKSIREIEALGMYNTRNNWIVIAWCRKQDNYREFRLDRIRNIKKFSEKGYKREFDLANYFKDKIASLGTPDIGLSDGSSNFGVSSKNRKVMKLIGIKTRTLNDGQATTDIPALWGRYLSPAIQGNLPEKSSGDIYCVYCDYDSDHLGPYTAFIGCPVKEGTAVPEGLEEMTIEEGEYKHFLSKGNVQQGSVYNTWKEIWETKMDRAYKTDYEIYGAKAIDPTNAEVDIYIGLK